MVSLEFASRGCEDITSVDLNFGCVKYLKDNTKKLDIKGIKALKSDAFKFITKFNKQVDIVFASPPYAIEKDIPNLSDLVFEHNILKPDGWCIVETNDLVMLDEKPYFSFKRNYGSTVFNFFEWNPEK
jgi:16S rRNA G966 N2-methylase RsmD